MSATKSQMVFSLKSQCGSDIPHPDGGTTWTTPWLANDELCNQWALERAKEWGAQVVMLASATTKIDEPRETVTVPAAALRQAREEMIGAIERAGFYVSGPTDHRAAEDGELVWVCRMREALRALGGTP